MRKVIYCINFSIDGCVDHTKFSGDEELFDYFIGTMDDVDLSLYGRKMYGLMFPYWAEVAKNQSGTNWQNEFAQKITEVDKVVFSRTLDNAEYNTRIVRTDPADELRKLKQAPGKNITVDTVSLFAQLAQAGLIDEYHLLIHPVIVGQGPRLVENGSLAEKLNLKLVGSRTFKSGVIAFHYAKQA